MSLPRWPSPSVSALDVHNISHHKPSLATQTSPLLTVTFRLHNQSSPQATRTPQTPRPPDADAGHVRSAHASPRPPKPIRHVVPLARTPGHLPRRVRRQREVVGHA